MYREQLTDIPLVQLVYKNPLPVGERSRIYNSLDVYATLFDLYSDTFDHHMATRIILVNSKNELLGLATIAEGGLNCNIVDIRFILQAAILSNAKGVVVCTNNPSAQTEPEDLDNQLKKEIRHALSLFDISLLDYLLINTEGFYSYADNLYHKIN